MRNTRNNAQSKRNAHRAEFPPLVEPLESRQLLSASLDHGMLAIAATAHDDRISVWAPANRATYTVDINGQRESFPKAAVRKIRISSGAGDDEINVNRHVTVELAVSGGSGQNRLLGRAAAQTPARQKRAPDPVVGEAIPANNTTGENRPQVSPDETSLLQPAKDQHVFRMAAVPMGPPRQAVLDPTGPTVPVVRAGASPVDTALEESAVPFKVYDATLYSNKPADLASQGFAPVYLTGLDVYSGTYPNFDSSHPDEAATRALARRVAAKGQLLVIDIEHWSLDIRNTPLADVQQHLTWFMQIADWVHSERPQLKVGFYGVLPIRDYWNVVQYPWALDAAGTDPYARSRVGEFKLQFNAWKQASDFLKPLADKVDFIVPSLYTFYENQEGWRCFAEAQIEQAKEYGKPVIPFLWMDYHNSTALAGQHIPDDYWRMELQTVRDHADGAIIWGGWQMTWDANNTWWPAVQQIALGG